VLLAPTAGGKTEAAAFPLLSAMEQGRWVGLSVLYLCPLKALLNNLLPRLETYAGWLGRRTALWHGDIPQTARRRILTDPPDILLTTPESLEAMLVSTYVDQHRLFASLRRRRRRGPRLRCRRPRLAPPRRPGATAAPGRPTHPTGRAVRHRGQPRRPPALAPRLGP
jgi:CRISPR/Cas system-associated endonuclease/helicase Cas3